MKFMQYFKMIVIIASILLMQVPQPCKAIDFNDNTKDAVCFIGQKVVLGIFAAGAVWCFWTGIQKMNNPMTTKKTKTRCFQKEAGRLTIRATQAEATQEITEVQITKIFNNSEFWHGVALALAGGSSFVTSTIFIGKK